MSPSVRPPPAAAGAVRGRATLLAATLWLAATLYLHRHAGFAVEEMRLLAFGVLAAVGIRTLDAHVSHVRGTSNSLGRGGYSLYAFHAPVLILLIILVVRPWGLFGTVEELRRV